MSDFKVVDRSHIPQKSGRGTEPSELALALARNEVVFLPSPVGAKTPSAVMVLYNKSGHLKKRGLQPRQRRGVEDGVEGLFLWAERNGTS